MRELDKADRLRLLKFVCSFAWTDLRVTDSERNVIRLLATAHGLDEQETAQVNGWLEVPPRAEELDPASIPRHHRERFLECARLIIVADGQVAPVERDALRTFEELLT